MTSEDRATRSASLKWQLRFHHERRKMVETDPELTPDLRAMELAYHDKIIARLQQQVRYLEGP